MAKEKFYVTTPIYYPNDIPHLGHAYTTIAADVLARWHKLLGKDVFFLTGTDEHGKKLEETAKKSGKEPKEFIDSIIPEFKEAWEKLNIKYDRFIRTTDKDHEKTVQEIAKKIDKSGDIYKGKYEGLYCTGCEAYYTEKDSENGDCPIHKKPLEKIKEETYFFKLSKYQDFLLELYEKNPDFISPNSKRKEIINRVKEGLKDLSITRTSFDWGIEFPLDKKHIFYVWMDALTNYYTATLKKGKEKFWPADTQIIGKDILWFHAVYWPAFLKSAGIPLPKKIFAHGWWTVHNEKMGKSAGNAIKIDDLISYAGVDSARYFLLRETPFGDDGDFSEKAIIESHNGELANKLGNLVSRTTTLAEKYGIEKTKSSLNLEKTFKKVKRLMSELKFDKALNEIFSFIDKCNAYIQKKKPWETKDKKILYELIKAIKDITILLSPFIPETSNKIAKSLKFEISINNLNKPLKINNIKKAPILFNKIGYKPRKSKKIEGITTMEGIVEYGDWEKLDLRVAEVKKIEDIVGADKLYKLTLDVGEIGERTICAGLKEFYKKEELKDKKIILFANLKPRKMKGIESQGMLLAASNKDHTKVTLLSPEKDIENGAKIS